MLSDQGHHWEADLNNSLTYFCVSFNSLFDVSNLRTFLFYMDSLLDKILFTPGPSLFTYCVRVLVNTLHHTDLPALVARLDVCLTGDQEVVGSSIAVWATFFHGD